MRNYIQLTLLKTPREEEVNLSRRIIIAVSDIVALEERPFKSDNTKMITIHTKDTKCFTVEEPLEEILGLMVESENCPSERGLISRETLIERIKMDLAKQM